MDEKRELVRQAIIAWRARPTLTFQQHADSLGLQSTILRKWMNDYGKPYGWTGSIKGFDRSKPPPAPAALAMPVVAGAAATSSESTTSEENLSLTPPASAWADKFGGELREAMGIEQEEATSDDELTASQTLISSGMPSRRKTGRPSNAERARRQAEIEPYGGGQRAFSPRRVEVYPPDDDRQPELPFRAEPVRTEPPRAATNEFTLKALEQSLKERDAFKTVCEILLREKSGAR